MKFDIALKFQICKYDLYSQMELNRTLPMIDLFDMLYASWNSHIVTLSLSPFQERANIDMVCMRVMDITMAGAREGNV